MLSKEKREFALTVAAILHDIGKVAQRYTSGKTHASLGKMFINNLPNLDRDVKDLASTLVGEHHLDDLSKSSLAPEDRELLVILQDADRKSASHDRNDRDPQEFREDPRMHNIYEYVSLSGEPARKSQRTFSLVTVESLAQVKKGKDPLTFNDITYQKIWNDLAKEVSKLSALDYSGFFDSLDSILMNYLTFVPSAFYYSEPNVTLYDHLRLTAAIALCEYRSAETEKDENVLFVMGEVSGIQKYIFNYMVSESADDKATKRLRGRSFVVRLITDSVVSLIINRLRLFRFNVVWEKADGFLIVMNSSPSNKEMLSSIRREVDLGLFELGRGPSLAMSWKEMPLASMEHSENEAFRKVLDSIVEDISTKKTRQLDDMMKTSWQDISVIESPSGRICRFCGLSHTNNGDRCRYCKMEEKIGEELVWSGKINVRNDGKGLLTLKYGHSIYSYYMNEGSAGDAGETIYINSFDHSDIRHGSRTILQGNFSPTLDGSVKTLNELLCHNRVREERCLYLGIAKTDVDNMGLIVTEGLEPLTLSRYASLSWLTSIFFSVIVNSIAELWGVYVIYSGGDDISAMGEATSILAFSLSLRNAFSQWVRNDQVTLSTGIALTDHSFPVRKGMEIASKNLENAKGCGKNSLGIFDLAIAWKRAEELMDISTQITNFISEDGGHAPRLGSSFLRVLLSLDEENPYVEGAFSTSLSGMKRKVRVRVPDSYIFYYLRRNLAGSDENEARQLTSLISGKEVFSNIRFVAYSAIVNLRKDEYGKQKN
ncbi:MAG: type III-A CRISPR-associated protein Cas10/Csm1 [Thermoplasmatales archaeon]